MYLLDVKTDRMFLAACRCGNVAHGFAFSQQDRHPAFHRRETQCCRYQAWVDVRPKFRVEDPYQGGNSPGIQFYLAELHGIDVNR